MPNPELIEELRGYAERCNKCGLGCLRHHAVLDDGYQGQKIMLIGEGPGETEDETGRPFTGPAGILLDEILSELGMRRDRFYICNILKCRPPGNATPTEEQTAACTPILRNQVLAVEPELIVSMGNPATKWILSGLFEGRTIPGITRIHGRTFKTPGGRTVFPVFHTAYALRREEEIPVLRDDFAKIKHYYDKIYGG